MSIKGLSYSWITWQGIKSGSLKIYLHNAKLKSANISYLQVHTKFIFLQREFGTQTPNLIPVNISGYMVHSKLHTTGTFLIYIQFSVLRPKDKSRTKTSKGTITLFFAYTLNTDIILCLIVWFICFRPPCAPPTPPPCW